MTRFKKLLVLSFLIFFYNQTCFAIQMKWEKCADLLQLLGEKTIKAEQNGNFIYELATKNTVETIATFEEFYTKDLPLDQKKVAKQLALAINQAKNFPALDPARYPLFGFTIRGTKAIEDLRAELQYIDDGFSQNKVTYPTQINLATFLFASVYFPHLVAIMGGNGFPLWSYPILFLYINSASNLYAFTKRMNWPHNNFAQFLSPIIEGAKVWNYQSSSFVVLKDFFRSALLAKINPEENQKLKNQYGQESDRDTFGPLLNFLPQRNPTMKIYVDEIAFSDPGTGGPVYSVLIRGTDH